VKKWPGTRRGKSFSPVAPRPPRSWQHQGARKLFLPSGRFSTDRRATIANARSNPERFFTGRGGRSCQLQITPGQSQVPRAGPHPGGTKTIDAYSVGNHHHLPCPYTHCSGQPVSEILRNGGELPGPNAQQPADSVPAPVETPRVADVPPMLAMKHDHTRM